MGHIYQLCLSSEKNRRGISYWEREHYGHFVLRQPKIFGMTHFGGAGGAVDGGPNPPKVVLRGYTGL